MAIHIIGKTLLEPKLALILVGLALAACEPPLPPPDSPAPSKVVEKKATPKNQAKQPSKPSVVYEYSYRPIGKRDPFRSVLDDLAEKAVEAATVKARCGPLCKWDLEQLRLVGVISGISRPFGMVEDPNGVGYVIQRNTSIGRRNGKVSQVRSGEIVITEVYKDQAEKPFLNSVVLKIPQGTKDVGPGDVNLFMPEVAE
jgi:type IV pilus assembly protein PilP